MALAARHRRALVELLLVAAALAAGGPASVAAQGDEDGSQHELATGACQKGGRPYLVAEVNGGLNNQRWVMLAYLAAAKRYNLTFVVGTLNMELMNECQGRVGFKPFTLLYSLDALVDFGARHGMSVLAELSPEAKVRFRRGKKGGGAA